MLVGKGLEYLILEKTLTMGKFIYVWQSLRRLLISAFDLNMLLI